MFLRFIPSADIPKLYIFFRFLQTTNLHLSFMNIVLPDIYDLQSNAEKKMQKEYNEYHSDRNQND